MAYDRQFLSLDFVFLLNGTPEVAYTGINYSVAAGFASAAAALAELNAASTTWSNDCLAALSDLMDSPNLGWADYSHLTGLKMAAIGTDGKYLGEPVIREQAFTVGATTNVPPQSTVVLSLRSGSTFGAANYGRMYLPHTRLAQVAGTPSASTATTGPLSIQAGSCINAITAALQAVSTHELIPTIMTFKTGSAARAVQRVGFGSVSDTQRRRRNRLPEVYTDVAL